MKNRECPLTSAEMTLVQSSIDHPEFGAKQLAALLHVETNTVNTHFANIHEKLGVTNRLGMTIVCLMHGWARLPDFRDQKITNIEYSIPRSVRLQSQHKGNKDRSSAREEPTRMAIKRRYYTVDGMIIGEKAAGGTRVDYLTDALGSVVATKNQNAQIVNTYRYTPSGAVLAKTGNGPHRGYMYV